MTDIRLIQLLDGEPGYADMITPAGLAAVAEYAYGIGADKDVLVPRGPTDELLAAGDLVDEAHEVGLAVHAWTFRAENRFLPLDFRIGADPDARGDIISEYELFLRLGIDGLFTDHPDTAVAARAGLLSATVAG
jgi:glycerophosphoryl diester phosphodiesterase